MQEQAGRTEMEKGFEPDTGIAGESALLLL
jgi:hypothetical protein